MMINSFHLLHCIAQAIKFFKTFIAWLKSRLHAQSLSSHLPFPSRTDFAIFRCCSNKRELCKKHSAKKLKLSRRSHVPPKNPISPFRLAWWWHIEMEPKKMGINRSQHTWKRESGNNFFFCFSSPYHWNRS